jgi:hypothetical protein
MPVLSKLATVGALIHQIPNENQRVVTARSQRSAAVRGPFDTIHRCSVAGQFQKSLAGLSYVEDADYVRFLRKGRKVMSVIRRC